MIYFLISAVIFITDCMVKNWAEKKLEYNKPQKKLRNMLIIRKVYNKGGALNTLDDKQEFVAGFSTALLLSVIVTQLLLIGRKGSDFLKVSLSFIIGGAASNVYDRLARKYVVDYFSFNAKMKKIRDIVFNLSDMFIFIGMILSVIYTLYTEKSSKR